jgi:hypothetical protein
MTPDTTTSAPGPSGDVPEQLRQKARAQGVEQTATYEHLLGAGRHLWADDAEFDRFLAAVEAIRAESP